MKHYLKVGILILIALVLSNCSKDSVESIEDINLSENNKELLEILYQWGFTDNDIEEYNNAYVVQGDMVFYKNKKYLIPDESNKNINSKDAVMQYVTQPNQRVDIRNIKIYLNPGLNSNWVSASVSAIARWNQFNCLTLTRVYEASEAHIEIMYDTDETNLIEYDFIPLQPNIFGRADYPKEVFASGLLPGKKIWINPDADFLGICGSSESQSDRIATVQHEIGHTLGIMHTNQTGAYFVPGTPTSDALSVMNGNSGCTINDFSYYDIVTVNYLFPCPTLTGNYDICGGSQTYSLTGGKAISWEISSNLQILSSSETSVTVQPINSSTNGAGYVEANTYSGKVRYNVWVNKFNQGTFTGTNAVCPYQAYHYTIAVPGGHKSGYTYRWTMPTSDWNIYGSSSGPTIYAGPSGSNVAGQMLVEVNTGCGGWSLVGGLITYPSYSCP
jgi:hypothetical protein